ncbi:S24 family peptidase [Methylopila sp. 73B]|uniref:LexA family protein n=1 Tax=Methylopila sp. 73B TaxID=1120792 RepID=UPI001FD99120|nr:S24 family peptidase [Methylopila sp. 73B]
MQAEPVRNGAQAAKLLNQGFGWFTSHFPIVRNSHRKASAAYEIFSIDRSLSGMRNPRMTSDGIIEWLRQGLEKPGKSQSGLARHLGVAPAAINRALKGQREIKARELDAIATYLGEAAPLPSSGSELTLFEGDLIPVRVVGVVEAGAFREANEFVEVEHVTIYEPRDPKFPRARLFALDVDGDSMNDLKPRPILEGDRVICVDFDDLGGRVPIQNGMVVVVEQTRDGGHLREWSVKQVEWHDDETWFCPRSTNPKHKPIKVKRDYAADDGREVRLMGLVRAVRSEMAW